jgi:outer membrane murein-binding lipoprotein Lpp
MPTKEQLEGEIRAKLEELIKQSAKMENELGSLGKKVSDLESFKKWVVGIFLTTVIGGIVAYAFHSGGISNEVKNQVNTIAELKNNLAKLETKLDAETKEQRKANEEVLKASERLTREIHLLAQRIDTLNQQFKTSQDRVSSLEGQSIRGLVLMFCEVVRIDEKEIAVRDAYGKEHVYKLHAKVTVDGTEGKWKDVRIGTFVQMLIAGQANERTVISIIMPPVR